MAGPNFTTIDELSAELDRLGVSSGQKSAILRLAATVGVNAPNVQAMVDNAVIYGVDQAQLAAGQAATEARLAPFNGDASRLNAFENTFEQNFTPEALAQIAPGANLTFDTLGVTPAAQAAMREGAGMAPLSFNPDTGKVDNTAQEAATGFATFFGSQPVPDAAGTTGTGGRQPGMKRAPVGTVKYGQTTQLVETDEFGNYYINGRLADMANDADRSIVTAGIKAGPDGTGTGGRGGGGGASKQNIGVDKDGFALIFDPATGAITKGPQVGFGQIDPRITAAEDARRFNEQQGLREGEFQRDVLANGRNFLTAAALTRGGTQSFTTGTTQRDLLRAGGVGTFPASGTTGQTAGFTTGTPGGIVRPGEIDPNTLSRPSQQFGTSSAFATGNKPSITAASGVPGGFDHSNLGAMALAFAPPAIKDIAAGREVGGLSTPGSIKLANPQTLANLTADEKGALDTTLQNVDQRTFGEFKQESDQRFRGQGSRRAKRSA